MKKGLHPSDYRAVVVEDISNGWKFLTKSTAKTDETVKWEDGNEYPLVKVHISSASHPFYTGQEKLVDVEGRVDRFKARAEAAKKQKEKIVNKAVKNAKRSAKSEDVSATKIGDKKYDVKPKADNKKEKQPEKAEAKTEAKSEEKPAEDKKDDK